MTYAAQHGHFTPYFADKASPKSHAAGKTLGVLWRIFEAVVESRQKRVDRQIARLLTRSGGRMTDDIEREMTQSLLTDNWNVRQ